MPDLSVESWPDRNPDSVCSGYFCLTRTTEELKLEAESFSLVELRAALCSGVVW
jgi:hypothetical protein